ncbi:hypothetical protein ACO0QE_000354 [Hanseniaspora vineae]
MGYYDLDDILADATKVPCKFNYTIPGLGYLESNPGKPLNKNSKLELPMWMARILATVEVGQDESGQDPDSLFAEDDRQNDQQLNSFIDLLIPEMFQNKVFNAIKSGSISLDVHSICPYYYVMAQLWSYLYQSEKLSELTNNMLKERAIKISNFASYQLLQQDRNSASVMGYTDMNNQNFLLTLDEFEKEIFRKTQESYKNTEKWMHE